MSHISRHHAQRDEPGCFEITRVWVLCHYVRMYSERNPTNGPKHVNHRVSIIACNCITQFQQLSNYSVIRFLWCKRARCSLDQTFLGLKMCRSMLIPLIWAFSSWLEGHWYIQKVSVPSSTVAENWDTRRQEDVGDQHPSRSTCGHLPVTDVTESRDAVESILMPATSSNLTQLDGAGDGSVVVWGRVRDSLSEHLQQTLAHLWCLTVGAHQ